LLIPDANFRLNPKRAVHVVGKIDQALVAQLTPQILKLSSESREPISLYISSPGGYPASMDDLLRILRAPDQDRSESCRIITAVTSFAASAGADLLCSGDYALAYPSSIILYHGVRASEAQAQELTLEYTSYLAKSLRFRNDRFARDLATKIESRFLDRFVAHRYDFDNIRVKLGAHTSDFKCFAALIESNLSKSASELWTRTMQRRARYTEVLVAVTKALRRDISKMSPAQFQANALRRLITYKLSENRKDKNWTFSANGLDPLIEDFFLLEEFFGSQARLAQWCSEYGPFVLDSAQAAQVAAINNETERNEAVRKLTQPLFQQLIGLFSALCHALQEGENILTGRDAYWLCLVDEVVGEPLPCVRILFEYKPDPKPRKKSVINSKTLRKKQRVTNRKKR
jgi:ATP-dependent protease ClpP protease subunit